MKMLAHRGLWTREDERNTAHAIVNAYRNGFGIETDLRDYTGKLVISHDVAFMDSPMAEEVFAEYKKMSLDVFLALNVKADGICAHIRTLINKYNIKNYAVFDMSIPEMMVYDKMGVHYFTRQSEIEPEPVLYERAIGVWMDEWESNWIKREIVEKHLRNGKYVGIISPEIHARDREPLWRELKQIRNDRLMLCTDVPLEARRFFDE